MLEGKKFKMVLAGIAGTLLVLLIKALFPDLPDGVVEWAIGVVGGVPALGAAGQSFADGMSRGLTSSQGPGILAAQQATAERQLVEKLNLFQGLQGGLAKNPPAGPAGPAPAGP